MSENNEIAFIDSVLCLNCGTCRDLCSAQAIIEKDGVSMVESEKCTGCGVCASNCPNNAIMMQKKAGT